MAESRILVARIGAAHGIRGEVRVKPHGDNPLALTEYGPLETADGARRFTAVSARPQKGMVVVRFKGVDDRNAAEALNGVDLYVPRDRLPEPEDDEFYHSDLIGLAAVTASGERVGTIVAVPNFGASDLVEIEPEGGRSFYLPFSEAFVPEIDLAGGRIVVEIPEGYLSGNDTPSGLDPDE